MTKRKAGARVHRRALVALACSLLMGTIALATAACNQPNAAPLASLRALPEANLPIMPGATLIVERSSPRDWSIDSGWAPAYLKREFGMNPGVGGRAAQDVVDSYYSSILIPRGWTDTCHLCGAWKKAGFTLELSFPYYGAWSPAPEQAYSLVFDEVLAEDLDTASPSHGQG